MAPTGFFLNCAAPALITALHAARRSYGAPWVDWIRKGGALPPDTSQELIAALTRTTYSFRGDRLLLEPKDQVKARLGYSPDDADAFALTFAQPVAARDHYYDRTMGEVGMRSRPRARPGQCLVEYDVLKRR